jgi:DNA-binding NarL/FixJ family response regulator
MTASVVILEPARAFRRGLMGALTEAGYSVTDDPADAQVAVVTMRGPEDCDLIDDLSTSHAVLALLPDPSPANVAHALAHGVAGVVDWAADPGDIAVAVASALTGELRLPTATVSALAAEWPDAHAPRPEIDAEEIDWLTALAAGTTVTRLADDAGYSERAMFRRLHDLYTRLGVTSRAEAIVTAERLGLLDHEHP